VAGALTACSSSVPGVAEASDLAAGIQSVVEAASPEIPPPADDPDPGQPDPATDVVTSTSTEREPLTVQVDKTGWYAGFAVAVEEVTANEGFRGVDLEVRLSFENQTDDIGYTPTASVEVDGAVHEVFADNEGEVPAGAIAKGTVSFNVEPANSADTISFEDAIDSVVLVYGDARDNQTRIPLAADADVESVQPKDLPLAGGTAQGQVQIELAGGTLGPSYESGEKNRYLVDVRIKLTCATGCQASGYYVDRTYLTLTGSAGDKLPADRRSGFCCEALYPETVSDAESNVLTFVVDAPGTGDYTLTYEDPALTTAGSPPATIAFTA